MHRGLFCWLVTLIIRVRFHLVAGAQQVFRSGTASGLVFFYSVYWCLFSLLVVLLTHWLGPDLHPTITSATTVRLFHIWERHIYRVMLMDLRALGVNEG